MCMIMGGRAVLVALRASFGNFARGRSMTKLNKPTQHSFVDSHSAVAPREGSDAKEKALVINAAQEVLRDSNRANPMRVGDLLDSVRSRTGLSRPEKRIYYDLLEASNDKGSPIFSRKGPGGGYYLDEVSPSSRELAEEEKNISVEKIYEKHLYPIVREWFISSKGLHACEIPNKRNGGTWSNPDLVCFKNINERGVRDVETYAIEVKTSLYKWKQFFFQAVAYKDIANRTYFVFRDDGESKELDELKRAAVRYGVGVVQIRLSNSEYMDIKNYSRYDDKRRAELNDLFEEYVPASYSAVSSVEKVALLERAGVSAGK